MIVFGIQIWKIGVLACCLLLTGDSHNMQAKQADELPEISPVCTYFPENKTDSIIKKPETVEDRNMLASGKMWLLDKQSLVGNH